MNLSEIRADCRSHLNESSAVFWQDDELDRWINEAMRDIARRSEILQDTHAIDVKAGQEAYDLPPDFLRIHRVEYRETSSNTWALEFRPIMEMDDIWLRSRTVSSAQPYYWTYWGSQGGSQQLRVYPIPSADNANGLVLYYYRLPRKVQGENDPLDIPLGWQDLIPLYVEVIGRRKDNDSRWREAQDIYLERLEQMMRLTRQPTEQMTFISPGMFGGFADWGWD